MGYHAHQIRVVIYVGQFTFDIVEIDIDGDCANLESRQHSLDVLAAIAQLQADVVALPKALGSPIVCKPVGALIQFGECQPALVADDSGSVWTGVSDALE